MYRIGELVVGGGEADDGVPVADGDRGRKAGGFKNGRERDREIKAIPCAIGKNFGGVADLLSLFLEAGLRNDVDDPAFGERLVAGFGDQLRPLGALGEIAVERAISRALLQTRRRGQQNVSQRRRIWSDERRQ